MHEYVTLMRPEDSTPDPRRSGSLPPDLLAQVRGRVRLLALFLLVAFGFDPVIFFGRLAAAAATGGTLEDYQRITWQWVDVGATLLCGALWWGARSPRVSNRRLLTLGLVFEVGICFIISLSSTWQYHLQVGMLPNMTWVPALIILFPLILPGPPRQMLVAALLSAATSPLTLLLLQSFGVVTPDQDAWISSIVKPGFAVGFAYIGARIVYGLGREVAAARELGSYRLEQPLGRGGMGEVWRARHRLLARPAAVKLIRPLADPEGRPVISENAIRRFEREAQVIARLRSPHTVELFDFGVADNGTFYYVMELLEGLDADSLVRRFGPIPAERVVYLLRQVCHSLSEAESCGLVHRDIKPANIFLCRYGEDHDFVKVLDFGLVKALDDDTGKGPMLTGENLLQGTPAFIAPEQALGKADLDGRVDIYATGCVAYWLLTGQLVFTGANSMAMLMQHAQATPLPPSGRTELPIPAELDRIVLSCLAKDPGARPQTARELLRRLDQVQPAGTWSEDRARDWWNAHQPPSTS